MERATEDGRWLVETTKSKSDTKKKEHWADGNRVGGKGNIIIGGWTGCCKEKDVKVDLGGAEGPHAVRLSTT